MEIERKNWIEDNGVWKHVGDHLVTFATLRKRWDYWVAGGIFGFFARGATEIEALEGLEKSTGAHDLVEDWRTVTYTCPNTGEKVTEKW